MTDEIGFPINRRLFNLIDKVATERFTVVYRKRFGGEFTLTGTVLDAIAYILPSDEIIEVTRAVQ